MVTAMRQISDAVTSELASFPLPLKDEHAKINVNNYRLRFYSVLEISILSSSIIDGYAIIKSNQSTDYSEAHA